MTAARAGRAAEPEGDPTVGVYEKGGRSDRSLGGLFADLARETSNLARSEIELAKAELSEKAGKAAGGAGLLAAGALVAWAGLLFLLAAVALALAELMAPWLAALIVGAVVGLAGIVLLAAGRRRLKTGSLQPERTIRTLKEDTRWVQSQLGR